MSVDFPAPFSPISAWISQALTWKAISSSARTLGKLLQTWSMERSTALPPQSDRACAPATEGDRSHDQGAQQELHPVWVDVGEHQPILDQRDDKNGKDCSGDRDVAASQGRAADDRGGE